MPDYSKCVIYKLCCNDTSIKEIYIGSTCNFRKRKNDHKSACHNENHIGYNFKVYQFIREHGGFQNWQMIMIHEQSVNNKLEKERLERTFIEDLKPSLNCAIPTRTMKEWRSDNKEHVSEYYKQYYETNKEHKTEYKKEYYIANKEHKSYLNKQYYETHKEHKNQKHDCECGGKYTQQNKTIHLKTKKHQKYETNAINI